MLKKYNLIQAYNSLRIISMPRTTYSQLSVPNRDIEFDQQSVRRTKKKTKIHKKKHQRHSSKLRGSKNMKKSNLMSKYKSAYSPQHTIQIHDIELSSFHSDEVQPHFHHSQDQQECTEIKKPPFMEQFQGQIYKRFCEDFEKRDLIRIMQSFKLTDQTEGKMKQ